MAAATFCRTHGKESVQTETHLYRQAAAAAAAVATAAAPRVRPGKAWRRSEFSKRGVSGAAGNGNGNDNGDGNRKRSGQVQGVIDGCVGGGYGDGGDSGDALPGWSRHARGEDRWSKTSMPRGRGLRDGVPGFDDGVDDSGDDEGARGDGLVVRVRRREGWVTRDRRGSGGGGSGWEGEEEPPALPQHSSSSPSSSSSSTTSGILVRRGLKTGEILADRARRRRREKLGSPVASSALPRVDVPLLRDDDGEIQHLPLGVLAARVQQQR